ncbi:MAG: FtsH protease activity modulator HflK [Gammaproteobacteria bacterium]|nr:FtsH protease activity modulator HflK [Gammaproteobacteria bacterium]MDH5692980.1 FtsH protease activity modulator HflK [Gammaproteobacteria bacterium]
MAWNEPGNSGGGKNPWGGGGNNSNQGPPDLDQIVKDWQRKLSRIFGGKGGGGGDSMGGGDGGGAVSSTMVTGVLILLAIVWGATGIYIVEPAERGVVTRFGKFTEVTQPGPHWHLPYPVEDVEKVDVDQVRKVEVGFRSTSASTRDTGGVPQESQMLTQDENIVDIRFAVQYRVKEAKDYLYNVKDPDSTLRQATETAIREVIGKSRMDFVLTEGQSTVADGTQTLIQDILDRYQSGLIVTSVNLQSAQPPREVKPAFEDAIKAREDEQRLKNEAQAYANGVVPRARGAAARQMEEANGYKARVIAQAEGEAARFESVLSEYKRAPLVTRQRLYIEAMESVMSNTTKVMVDVKGGGNIMYLPLDRMVGAQQPTQNISVPTLEAPVITDSKTRRDAEERRRDLRSREAR